MRTPGNLIGWIAQWLPRNGIRLRRLRLHFVGQFLWRLYSRNTDPFFTCLHGFRVRINGGNPYPFLLTSHPLFNRPLVELVRQVAAQRARGVFVIDVGSSLGNTVLLLHEQCPNAISRVHCVEADPDFFPLLESNAAQFPKVVLHRAMLAAQEGPVASLVHHHHGSAAATGATTVPATTIDSLLLGHEPRFDILKIDIDGSDGNALAGSARLLARDHPAIIFEWHPALIRDTGNDPDTAFSALRKAGYRRLLWFWNTGHFSHFGSTDDHEIDVWHRYLLEAQTHGDPHFDIIALPPDLEEIAFPLAALGEWTKTVPQ